MKSAKLLALASEAQAVQVSSFLRTRVRRHYNEFWTAGNDIAREGDWVWAEAGARVRASNDGYRRLREVLQTLPVLSTRAFSWLKVPTSAFTFKTLSRHYDIQALTHSK